MLRSATAGPADSAKAAASVTVVGAGTSPSKLHFAVAEFVRVAPATFAGLSSTTVEYATVIRRSLTASAGSAPANHPTVCPEEASGVPKFGSKPVHGVLVPLRTQVTEVVVKLGNAVSRPSGRTSIIEVLKKLVLLGIFTVAV